MVGSMEVLVTFALVYLAIGAACFSHPPAPATPNDFHWQNQISVFRTTLPLVMTWPLVLWRLGLERRY